MSIFGNAQSAFAGAWPMPKGKGQSITTFTWQGATRGFDKHGKAKVDLSFQKYENAIFLEYGLTRYWTVVARPAVQNVRLRNADVVDEAQGLGATELSMRRALPGWKHWVLATQVGAFVPGRVENGFDKPLGQRGLDWEVRALAGRSFLFANRPGFLDVQMAFRERARGTGNEMRMDTTLGHMLTRHLQVQIQTNLVVGLPSTRPDIRTVDSLRGEVSAVWFFRRNYGVQLSASHIMAGRNVVRGSGYTLGFWRRF
jgi:hypothetical protein